MLAPTLLTQWLILPAGRTETKTTLVTGYTSSVDFFYRTKNSLPTNLAVSVSRPSSKGLQPAQPTCHILDTSSPCPTYQESSPSRHIDFLRQQLSPPLQFLLIRPFLPINQDFIFQRAFPCTYSLVACVTFSECIPWPRLLPPMVTTASTHYVADAVLRTLRARSHWIP